jgi:hypothetical protein
MPANTAWGGKGGAVGLWLERATFGQDLKFAGLADFGLHGHIAKIITDELQIILPEQLASRWCLINKTLDRE